MTLAAASIGNATREAMARWTAGLHDTVTAMFEQLDGRQFDESSWERKGGGGGQARLLSEGRVFEKAGVNRALVEGLLPPEAAARLGGNLPEGITPHFFATGVSVVAHPRSPMVPTVHLNVRYFALYAADGALHDAWYGGGTDLTPTHPFVDDARHFHRTLRSRCDAFSPAIYPAHKQWCDEYFRNTHRDNEARGVGGVFFDHLRPTDQPFGMDAERLHRYVDSIGRVLGEAYGPLVERRKDLPFTERDRALQLYRRSRYVEFNLLHDRGTLFGLQTGARTDSVLMSMPPLAAWPAPRTPEPGRIEAQLDAMLVPQDWALGG